METYFIWSRIDPTIPPTTPPCTVSRWVSCGIYSASACASFEIGSVCSQILPGPRQRRQENSIPAKNQIFDSRHGCDLKRHAGLKRSHMAGMHAQIFTGLEIAHHQLSG
jgi:hypothetical protein